MGLVAFLYKTNERIKKRIRTRYFKEYTGNNVSTLNIYGNIHLINKNIKIGSHVSIYPEVQFFGDGEIMIGDNVTIGNGTIIYASKDGGVSIGNNTLISAQCYIIDSDHGTKQGTLIKDQKAVVDKVIIGNDVWISAGCKILKGSVINDGCVIGAMSLVKGVVPTNTIAFGIPAKPVKERVNE